MKFANWIGSVSIFLVLGLAGPRAVVGDEFSNVLNSFGNLTTVSGTALIDGDGVNGWNVSMEGNPAIAAELSRPHMTMADGAGNLYVADKDSHAVRLITPDGTIHTLIGTNVSGFNGDGVATETMLSQPNGLYTFYDGTTFVLDLANSRIRRYANGVVETIIHDPSNISFGRGLWVSSDENLIYYASANRIQRWTPDEGISTYADGFVELGNFTIDPFDGTIVATDRGSHGVYKVFEGGSRLLVAGTELTGGGRSGDLATEVALNEVRGIDFDTTGGYYLATHRGSQIWYVDTSGIIHLLINGDRSNDTHSGDGFPLTTPGLKISEPRAVTLGPQREMLITENDGGYVRRVERAVNVLGDFDYDGALTTTDADLLSRVVQIGVDPMIFNLNPLDSRKVDAEDMRAFIEDLVGTTMGDANLDGLVDDLDLGIWSANQFVSGTTWSRADFNSDGITDGSDFNIWHAHRTLNNPAAVSVPEPTAAIVALAGLLCLIFRRR